MQMFSTLWFIFYETKSCLVASIYLQIITTLFVAHLWFTVAALGFSNDGFDMPILLLEDSSA